MIDQHKHLAGSDDSLCDDSRSSNKMPGVDLQSYLLAASPPGFDIHYAIRSSLRDINKKEEANARSQDKIRVVSATQSCRKFLPFKFNQSCQADDKILTSSRSVDSMIEFEKESKTKERNKHNSDTSLESRGKTGKKKVCFADDIGQQLEHIRILTDRSGSPPLIRPDFLSSLTNNSSAGASAMPPLKLNFTQPASDYIAFREKLESNNVSLENVILKDYNLMGTIKVKNIAFEKSVTVRHTCDNWETFEDVPGVYVDTSNTPMLFDTFSFEISVSPKLERTQTVQFAVMYKVGDNQFWDNNSGANYEVVPSTWKDETEGKNGQTDDVVFGLNSPNMWTNFCAWNSSSGSVPYW